jgi:hypothetical protein
VGSHVPLETPMQSLKDIRVHRSTPDSHEGIQTHFAVFIALGGESRESSREIAAATIPRADAGFVGEGAFRFS